MVNRTLFKIFLVAKFSIIEVLSTKVWIGLLILACGQYTVAMMAVKLTYGVPQRIAIDFGFALLSFSSLGLALYWGSSSIINEIESKTSYLILSRNISRVSLLIGKTIALIIILIGNSLLLFGVCLYVFTKIGGTLNPLLFWTGLFIMIEATVIFLVALFFSQVTNKTMTFIFSFSIFIAGHSLNKMKIIFKEEGKENLVTFVNFWQKFIPDLEKINFKNYVLYQNNIESSVLINAGLYIGSVSIVLVLLNLLMFSRKELL